MAENFGTLVAEAPAESHDSAVGDYAPVFPELAPGIELSGEMQDSGFAAGQWLIQRNGAFLQVNERLYRIAEHATGQCSVEHIAELVTKQTGRETTAAQVRRLIAEKLLPARIIRNPSEAAVDQTIQKPHSNGVLGVNLKLGVVSPRVLNPVTRVLQRLYWPPVVVLIILVAAGAHGWLYLIHGLGAGLNEALASPSWLLVALALNIAGAAFHELGHAAALQYSGGKVRGIGVGMYLIYPVFYTDVTDSYRLGRWARVRTDLGGFYFHLIFALGVMTAYAITGAEFLLITVFLISLDILRQSMPFVRMDGYWVLADLTGIPDLFSHVKPFAQYIFSLPSKRKRRPLPMKKWVTGVFALYILVTVPLLIGMLLLMVRNLPNITLTAASSMSVFGNQLLSTAREGEWLLAITSLVQLAIIAFPIIGLFLMLYVLAVRGASSLWSWGRPSAERRALASSAMVGATLGIGYLWAPHLRSAAHALSTASLPGSAPEFWLLIPVIALALVSGVSVVADSRSPDWTWRRELMRDLRAAAGAVLVTISVLAAH